MYYSTAQTAATFKVTAQTIRRWTEDFRKFLSPGASPEQGRTRLFSDADMEVLALVAVLKAEGKQTEDIVAALAAGERGQMQQLATVGNMANIEAIKQRISNLEQELEEERARRLEAEKGRAKAEGWAEGREQLLRERIQELEREIAHLRQSQN